MIQAALMPETFMVVNHYFIVHDHKTLRLLTATDCLIYYEEKILHSRVESRPFSVR